jgi:hypothetical protein
VQLPFSTIHAVLPPHQLVRMHPESGAFQQNSTC